MHRDTSTESWNAIADDWVAHADGNDYRNDFLMPLTLHMLGDVRGLRIVDVGCGDGGYARELAKQGATVLGIDGSERLIAVARDRAAKEISTATFACENASAMHVIDGGSFDVALATMSLMDVEDYPAAIAEVHRVLKPGGQLLMSITHPCFMPPVWGWVKDESGTPQYFKVDRYFDRGAWEEYIAPTFKRPVIRRHRTLEDYMAAPIRAGFQLTQFHEPTVTDADLLRSRRFWKLKRIPYFLFLRWTKC